MVDIFLSKSPDYIKWLIYFYQNHLTKSSGWYISIKITWLNQVVDIFLSKSPDEIKWLKCLASNTNFPSACIPSLFQFFVTVLLIKYSNRRNFRTRFIFVFFVLFAESTKFSSTQKPCMPTSVQHGTVKLSRWRHWLNFIKTNGAAPRAATSALQCSRLYGQLHQLWKSLELHERSKLDERCTCCHDRVGFNCYLLPLSHFSFFFASLGALHNPERSLNSRVLSTPASSNVLMTRRRSSSL